MFFYMWPGTFFCFYCFDALVQTVRIEFGSFLTDRLVRLRRIIRLKAEDFLPLCVQRGNFWDDGSWQLMQ